MKPVAEPRDACAVKKTEVSFALNRSHQHPVHCSENNPDAPLPEDVDDVVPASRTNTCALHATIGLKPTTGSLVRTGRP